MGIADNEFDENTGLHWVDPKFIKQVNAQFGNEDNFVLKLGAALKQIFNKVLLTTISVEEIKQDNKRVKFLHISFHHTLNQCLLNLPARIKS